MVGKPFIIPCSQMLWQATKPFHGIINGFPIMVIVGSMASDV